MESEREERRGWNDIPGLLEGLEPSVDAEGAAGHVFHLPGDVLGEAGLVLGQHLEHQTQVQPPLHLGHAVPAESRWRSEGLSQCGHKQSDTTWKTN